ncbi:MAG: substrate-binding domain-containing protein [Phycisphaeraceae bacterium]
MYFLEITASPLMAKSVDIAEVVIQRIRQGDYRLRPFPSINQLAENLRSNPRTVTKAVDDLVKQGVLRRTSTGRLHIRADGRNQTLQVALLQPAFSSSVYERIEQVLQHLVRARGWRMRPVGYTHWHDPMIDEALRGFDGVLFMPLAEDMPSAVLDQIRRAPGPVVVLDQDVSEHGIPCLRFDSPDAIAAMLDTLAVDGHERIACLNCQPTDVVIRERIERWQSWTQVHKKAGHLIDDHVAPFESPVIRAHKVVGEQLRAGHLRDTAVFCATGAVALGAMRALDDHGLEPGRDVAVCAADDMGGLAPFLRPSLTCLADPDWRPYLDVCLDWFAKGGERWIGPHLIHPPRMPVYVGESTSQFASTPIDSSQSNGNTNRKGSVKRRRHGRT